MISNNKYVKIAFLGEEETNKYRYMIDVTNVADELRLLSEAVVTDDNGSVSKHIEATHNDLLTLHIDPSMEADDKGIYIEDIEFDNKKAFGSHDFSGVASFMDLIKNENIRVNFLLHKMCGSEPDIDKMAKKIAEKLDQLGAYDAEALVKASILIGSERKLSFDNKDDIELLFDVLFDVYHGDFINKITLRVAPNKDMHSFLKGIDKHLLLCDVPGIIEAADVDIERRKSFSLRRFNLDDLDGIIVCHTGYYGCQPPVNLFGGILKRLWPSLPIFHMARVRFSKSQRKLYIDNGVSKESIEGFFNDYKLDYDGEFFDERNEIFSFGEDLYEGIAEVLDKEVPWDETDEDVIASQYLIPDALSDRADADFKEFSRSVLTESLVEIVNKCIDKNTNAIEVIKNNRDVFGEYMDKVKESVSCMLEEILIESKKEYDDRSKLARRCLLQIDNKDLEMASKAIANRQELLAPDSNRITTREHRKFKYFHTIYVATLAMNVISLALIDVAAKSSDYYGFDDIMNYFIFKMFIENGATIDGELFIKKETVKEAIERRWKALDECGDAGDGKDNVMEAVLNVVDIIGE